MHCLFFGVFFAEDVVSEPWAPLEMLVIFSCVYKLKMKPVELKMTQSDETGTKSSKALKGSWKCLSLVLM